METNNLLEITVRTEDFSAGFSVSHASAIYTLAFFLCVLHGLACIYKMSRLHHIHL